ncbi:hypothetical protein [Azospirillum sp. TSO35-2]|uniref:hypothetical protein n=1 Tax=Azospirillum sp. TSO35-2 TaxID=716796 RepID=UPI000D61E1AA|nr:hypothetical protein [Azospirillum sp. TSO35-2]PWC34208.1 hypothetical protein TSO352_28320 [Azospirillum sp. TSO35-2]
MRTGPTRHTPAPLAAATALAAGLLLSAPAAQAQSAGASSSCGAMVEQFAADQGLSTSPPPVAVPGTSAPGLSGSTPREDSGSGAAGGATSNRLAQSGGMVAPPAVGDRSVIEPPSTGSNMPTAPAVGADSGSRATPDGAPGSAGSSGGGLMEQAARNAQLESLVTAARSAARDGDESRCMDSLSDARRLSQTAPGGG